MATMRRKFSVITTKVFHFFNMNNSPNLEDITSVADSVANDLDADVLLYNGPIQRFEDKALIAECIDQRKRENVLLILVTLGGDPNAAYRISRCRKRNISTLHYTSLVIVRVQELL